MSTEQLVDVVRRQLALGRLLPLGTAADGVWLAERPAHQVLHRAAETVPGVRLTRLESRVATVDPGDAAGPAEPAPPPRPPSALPPGPLRISAEFVAVAGRPLPRCAREVRAALTDAATRRLGFRVAAVDLHVTDLLDDGPRDDAVDPPASAPGTAGAGAGRAAAGQGPPGPPDLPGAGTAGAVADAVCAVPGVRRLSDALGGPARAVVVDDGRAWVQLAVEPGERRVLEVAGDARRAAAAAAALPTEQVAVVVTELA